MILFTFPTYQCKCKAFQYLWATLEVSVMEDAVETLLLFYQIIKLFADDVED